MHFSTRRQLDKVPVTGAAVLAGTAASIGALTGDTERVCSVAFAQNRDE